MATAQSIIPLSVRADLVSLYNNDGTRHYHTLEHISHCLRELETIRGLIPQADYAHLVWALWFHDVVYDTHAKNNEVQSALLASQTITEVKPAGISAVDVGSLVIATAHDAQKHGNLSDIAKYMIDIDLAILGQHVLDYMEYSSKIRKEYLWVPPSAYRVGRLAVLKALLPAEGSGGTIYLTKHFQEKYEAQARANLTGEIALLSDLSYIP